MDNKFDFKQFFSLASDAGITQSFPDFDKIVREAASNFNQTDSVNDRATPADLRYAAKAVLEAVVKMAADGDESAKTFLHAVRLGTVPDRNIFWHLARSVQARVE